MEGKKKWALVYVVILFAMSTFIALSGVKILWQVPSKLGFLLFFSIVIGISNLMEVRFSKFGGMAVDAYFVVGAIINLPFPLSSLSVFIGEALSEPFKKKEWIKKIFNISQYTINTSIISYIATKFFFLEPFELNFSSFLLFILVSSTFTILSIALHSIVVSLFEGLRVFDVIVAGVPGKMNFSPLLAMTIMGILFAYLVNKTYVGAALSVFPVYILYILFKRTAMLEETLNGVLKSMITALEAKDPYTADHSKRVAEYSRKIAEKLGLSLADIKNIEKAALLHDLGKIGTPEEVLYKPDKLGYFEWKLISRHPEDGASILATIPLLKEIKDYVLHHHERANGSGYPNGKKTNEIPLGAQIIAIADAYDAMRSPRPYRSPFTIEEAFRELNQSKAYQFNPDIVTKLAEVVAENPHLEKRPIPVCSLPEIELVDKKPHQINFDA